MAAAIMSEPKIDPNQRSYRPEAEFIVNDLETLKVLADPLRLQIVELCTQAPRTVKQVATVLNMPPTKLYYHMKQLEERSLIRVVDTRIVSGIVEKQYQAAAFNYRVNRELFSLTSQAGKEGLNVMLTGLFDDTREDIQQSVDAEVLDVSAPQNDDQPLNRSLMISRHTLHLTPEEAEVFYQRLKMLVRETLEQSRIGRANPEAHAYGLLVSLYPSTRTGAADPNDT
jgi:DNA-binding transcriptional ArsR family regulator